MKILVTGNCGYVGPVLGRHLNTNYPAAKLYGLDTGYFLHSLKTETKYSPWYQQYFGDIRDLDVRLLKGIDTVVHLAAISNDPMGNRYQMVTEDINQRAGIRLAHAAKQLGVKRFVFASSCSIYGCASDSPRSEKDALNPLTAYARSKVAMEKALAELCDDNFTAICLRFSTACGDSPGLRLDLVLNDFVATALADNKIKILSDGSPWRPLIDVEDMSRAIEWAITTSELPQPWLAINIGSNDRNYQVVEIAERVSVTLGNIKTETNPEASPDKRSYKVDFSLFSKLAPNHQPRITLDQSILNIAHRLKDQPPETLCKLKTQLTRLYALENLQKSHQLDDKLNWIQQTPCTVARQN